jgi:D-sedoheptulose 7-phosphate isomerase
MKPQVQSYLDTLLRRYPAWQQEQETITQAYQLLATAYESGGKLLCAGNGGSAADAEHIVGELMKGLHLKRPLSTIEMEKISAVGGEKGKALAQKLQGALPSVSLVSSVALQTAFLNDVDGTCGFAQQVWGLVRENDVFLGISTSGNSENVILAAMAAKALGTKVVGLTGTTGGALKQYTDICLCAPATRVEEIQELHLPVYHCLCAMLEAHFFDA